MRRRWLFGLVAALAIYLGLTTAFGIQEVSATLGQLPWQWWLIAPAICLINHLVLEGRWQFSSNWAFRCPSNPPPRSTRRAWP